MISDAVTTESLLRSALRPLTEKKSNCPKFFCTNRSDVRRHSHRVGHCSSSLTDWQGDMSELNRGSLIFRWCKPKYIYRAVLQPHWCPFVSNRIIRRNTCALITNCECIMYVCHSVLRRTQPFSGRVMSHFSHSLPLLFGLRHTLFYFDFTSTFVMTSSAKQPPKKKKKQHHIAGQGVTNCKSAI